jgi:hypothetical protein
MRFLLFLCFCLVALSAASQVVFEKTPAPQQKIRVGFRTEYSFIDPSEVNNYIDTFIETNFGSQLNYKPGKSTDIGGAGALGIWFSVRVGKRIDVNPIFEFGWATTKVKLFSQPYRFTMRRIAPGFLVTYRFQREINRPNYPEIFGGLTYNFGAFNSEDKGSALGQKVGVAYNWTPRNTTWGVMVGGNFSEIEIGHSEPAVLDFSGIYIGLIVSSF